MSTTSVTASLRYLQKSAQQQVYTPSQPGVGEAHDIGIRFDERSVRITDARTATPSPELDREGFQLLSEGPPPPDSTLPDHARLPYEAAIREQLLSLTGATTAWVFDHTVRSDSASLRKSHQIREPAGFVHNDYTDASAHKRLEETLAGHTANVSESLDTVDRFCIINVWRSIAGEVIRSPVTCCDAQTIQTEELIAIERRAKERIGELEFALWNPRHRWYYFSAMTTRELLLIKTFDSDRSGVARRAIHTAFDNPAAPADSPPRHSIESRVLLIYR